MKVLFATGNKNKLKEAKIILSKYPIKLVMAEHKKIEIQSESIEKIALYAAKMAFRDLRKPLVVEDDGLFISALKGFPGPYSSYIFKTIGLKGILRLLKNIHNRKAYFKSVVAYIDSRLSEPMLFKGVVHGNISSEIRGNNGFGYDPIFIPDGYSKTFGEISIEEKTKISHRYFSFKKFAEWISKSIDTPSN